MHWVVWACLAVVGCHGGPSVQIYLNETGVDFPHYWEKCVGSGHALLGTRSDWQGHFRKVKSELGFSGARFHGLFDDDMTVVQGSMKHPTYGFYNVDQVYDFLLSIGVRPVVELSFMPGKLANCKPWGNGPDCQYVMHYHGIRQPPYNRDWSLWHDLVKALAEHLVARYGIAEVSQWHFEVWNELWGMPFPDDYMPLYNASATALKSVHPLLKVGGPATMQVGHIADFVARTSAAKIPVDFVSTHLYPTDPNCTHTQDKDCFATTVLSGQKQAGGLPFFLTEYNTGLGSLDNGRNTKYGASFLYRNIPLLRSLDLFSYWTFTDVFEEGGMPSAPFQGNNFGIQTLRGVPKPTYRAFQLLHQAGHELLRSGVSGPDSVRAFATGANDHENVRIYLSNFAYKPFPVTAETIVVHIHHQTGITLPSATAHLIDDKHCTPYDKWTSLGSPTYPTDEQLQQMMEASLVGTVTLPVTKVSPTEVTVTLTMQPYDAVVLTL